MAGGWASTLGAAILGGQQGYQQGKENQISNLMNAIKLKMAQDQLNELPKKHAEGDVDRQFARDGIASFNDPTFVKNNALAGQPIQTKDVMTPRLNQIEGNAPGNLAQTPVDSQAAMAAKMGVAPDTGAVIPTDLLLKNRQQNQQLTQADSITQFLQQNMGNIPGTTPSTPNVGSSMPNVGSPLGAPQPVSPPPGVDDPTFPNGVKDYVVKLKTKYPGDTPSAMAELQRAWPDLQAAHPNVDPKKVLSNFPPQAAPQGGAPASVGEEPPFEDPKVKAQRMMGKLTGLDTGEAAHESATHKVFMTNAEAEAKAKFKPPAAMVQKELDAYKKARLLIPELKQALMTQVINPNDPTGQQANPLRMGVHMAGQRIKAGAYDAGYPLSDVASKAQQLAGLFKVVGATPYMNGSRSMQMFQEAAAHLTDRKMTPEAQIQRLNELENIFPKFEDEIGFRPGEVKGGAPAANTPAFNAQSASNGAVNKNRTLAEVQALANMTKQDPKVIIQQVIAAGGTVSKQ